jgi:DNA-binding response OmpR family regulator
MIIGKTGEPMSAGIEISNKTILVAETQPFLRSIIVDILRNIGVTKIHTAGSCPEAVTQIRTWLPDAIILDWDLKDGTGTKLAQWVRKAKNSPNSEIPIVIVTGDTSQEKILEARDCGIDEIIVKPVVPRAVISRVHLLFEAKREFVSSHTFTGPDRRRRKNTNYKGSKRRLKDASTAIGQGLTKSTMNLCKKIQLSLDDLDTKNRDDVMDLYNLAQSLWQDASDGDHSSLETIGKSMMAYIQAVGISGKLAKSVISKHIDAIEQLKAAADSGAKEPTKLLNELQKLVSRQMSPQRAA